MSVAKLTTFQRNLAARNPRKSRAHCGSVSRHFSSIWTVHCGVCRVGEQEPRWSSNGEKAPWRLVGLPSSGVAL